MNNEELYILALNASQLIEQIKRELNTVEDYIIKLKNELEPEE